VTVTLLIVAAVVAVADWIAVDHFRARLEYVLKPATLALLIAAVATADLGTAKPWVLAALALGLIGDIALLRAAADAVDLAFMAGLSAFLLGHLAYLVAFVLVGVHPLPLVAGLLVAVGVGGLVLPAVLRRASADGGRPLVGAVAGYALAVGATTAFAAGTQLVLTAVGGLLFLVSDALIARERFVAPVPRGALLVASSYHLAQFAIVLGLLAA
jgi:uncharacterized membrane protein YhhN